MSTTMNNQPARPRRSLNDTIGRLDEMIDGLSEAIPGTIRDTLQESVGAAVREGVRMALLELLSNTEVLALLRSAVAPAPLAIPVAGPAPTLAQRLLGAVRSTATRAGRWCLYQVQAAGKATAQGAWAVVHKLALLRRGLHVLGQARRPLLVALAVGGLAATLALVAPSWVAALLSGLGGAAVTLALQAALWLRQNLSHYFVTSE